MSATCLSVSVPLSDGSGATGGGEVSGMTTHWRPSVFTVCNSPERTRRYTVRTDTPRWVAACSNVSLSDTVDKFDMVSDTVTRGSPHSAGGGLRARAYLESSARTTYTLPAPS